MNNPKYSIVVPVFNGMPYLKACIDSILSQNYSDYELIVSDDHSVDDSSEYLQSIEHPNVKIIVPDKGKSMAEHWEWALSFASGEWQIFVGQDDGLQKYFFSLADRLTQEATAKGLRAIVARRAYYFWPGLESKYQNRVNYFASNCMHIRSTREARLKSLFTDSYHNFPQMYCNSIFHKSLLDDAKTKQDGCVFVSHPQDANLAAICCKLERQYLWCGIPLGWVGTSLKSAGYAVSQGVKEKKGTVAQSVEGLKREYVERVSKSAIKYHYLAGDFGFADINVYFWQSLIQTARLNDSFFDHAAASRWFRYLFISSVVVRVSKSDLSEKKRSMLDDLIERNGFSHDSLFFGKMLFKSVFWLRGGYIFLLVRVPRKVMRFLKLSNDYEYRLHASDDQGVSLNQAGDSIASVVREKRWV